MSQDIVSTAVSESPLDNLPEAVRNRVLAARKAIQSSSEIGTKKIGVKQGGGQYKFPDDTMTNEFSGIIIGVKHANKYYPDEYVAGKVSPAACVAVDPIDEDSPNVKLIPVKQTYSSDCESCVNFQWGSNPKGSGKGKLCNEYTLLAVYVPSMGNDLYLLELKKARSAQVDGYIRRTTDRFGHPLAVMTNFKIGVNGQPFDQSFDATDMVSPELAGTLAERLQEADQMLTASVKNSLANSDDAPTQTADDAGKSGRKPRR